MREEFKPHSTLYVENKILSCKENKKRFQLETKEASFYLVKIDDGVEPKNRENRRCDFLVIKKDSEDIWIYVELKGETIQRSYEQILRTYKKYKQSNTFNYAAIVISNCPCATTSQNVKDKLRRQGFEYVFLKEKLRLSYDKNNPKKPFRKIG